MAAIRSCVQGFDGKRLRAASAKACDARMARRMLAIALDRQTLRDWVHRYNAEGLAGLKNRKAPGRPPGSRQSRQLSPVQRGSTQAP